MTELYDFLHDHVVYFTKMVRMFLELAGALVILYVAAATVYRFFRLRFLESCTELRVRLGRGIAMALSLYLAGELLRLVTVREYKDLAIVGVIVLLHVVISLVVSHEVHHSIRMIEEEEVLSAKGRSSTTDVKTDC